MAKRRRTAQTLQGYEYATISAEIAAAAAAAAAAFTDLNDVPVTYVGQSLKAVRVNAGETGLEFYTATSGSGSSGIGVPGVDGIDGESWIIPGPAGPAGSAGPAGTTGPAGASIPGNDGIDGEEWMIPGPAGPSGSVGSLAFTDLTDAPVTYASQGGRAVAVNFGETGLEFVDFPSSGSGLTQPQVMARSLGC